MIRTLLSPKIAFFVLLLVSAFNMQSQCDADFYFDKDSVDHLQVNFTNSSTHVGNLLEFEWKFGNEGKDSTNLNPNFKFPQEGEYEVSLIIKDDTGCSDTIHHMVSVGNGPECFVNFQHNQTQNPFEVSFTDNSNSSGTAVSWQWNFGDGGSSNVQNPVHAYTTGGDYQVCLEVSTSDSCVNSHCYSIHISDQNSPCKAEYFMDPDSITGPNSFNFTANQNTLDTTAQSFTWWIDNQTVSTSANFAYTFPQEGSYNICFAVTTTSGCSDTVCHQTNIGGMNCESKFNFDIQQATKEVFFQDESQSTSGVVSWKWDFGDSNTSTDPNPTHQYTSDGAYNVCLEITSSDSCKNTYCSMVNIGSSQNCMANFNDFSNSGLNHGFEDVSSAPNGIQTFNWNMGDGTNYSVSNFSHTFNAPGDYNVCLSIAGDQCQDTICRIIHIDSVQANGCQPNFEAIQDTLNPNLFSFNDLTQLSDGSVTTWKWDFGDGNQSTTKNATHNFANDGMYTVCLEIETDKGCKETHCDFVSIGQVDCHAEFSWDKTGVVDELKFQNQSFSDTAIISFNWDINGTAYTEEHPVHTFPDTGMYNVSLIINTMSGCTDTVFKEVYNHDDTQNNGNCQAAFNFNPNGNDGASWNFNDNSFADAGVSTWEYKMGDGFTYTSPNFTHAYSADGTYDICLTIQSNDGCADTTCQSITIQIDTNNHDGGGDSLIPIQGCLASFWIDKDPTDPNKLFFKSNSAHADGSTLNHLWHVNEMNYTSQDVEHQFTAAGTYDVKLEVSGNNCASAVSLPVKIGTNNCAASYSFVLDTLNSNRVQFALSGTNNLTGGFWQFGDGIQADQKDPIHEFPGPGFYNVCINAYDSTSGCQAQFCSPVEIKGNNQGGNCFAQFEFVQTDLTVSFTNTSQGDYTNINYTFSDGGVANTENPTHTFSGPGVYDVCITTFDSVTNCVADFCQPITVFADTNDVFCHADFNFFPIGEKKFAFANQSQGNFTEVKWEFNGGANVIKASEAEFEFATAGHHEVCLSIFDSISGCFNTTCKNVEIVDTNVITCKADFSFFKDAAGKISFNTEAQGAFTNVHYDLGDGTNKNTYQFNHIYKKAGHFNVCMSISDTISGCQDQICKMVAYAPDSITNFCEAKFDGFIDDDGMAHAQNLSIGDYTNTHWNFGDGFESFDNNPTHTFQNSGFYTICLNIFDTISGCQDNQCKEVNIQLDSADVNCFADFTYMVIDGEVSVQNKSVGNFDAAHWSFGDNGYADGVNANHYYNNTGVYDICLSIWDSVSGCQAHVCKPVTIVKDTLDVFCEAKFEFMPLPNGEIQFKDASIGSYTHTHWDLGNGVFADHNDPIGNYPSGGVFPVSIMIWDSINGCQASYKEEIVISGNTSQPECHAKFNFFPINDSLVKFDNASTGAYTNIHWEFGDGNFAEDQNGIEHTYAQGGFYKVCIGIFDSLSGCHDYVCKKVELLSDTNVVDCHAEFEFFPITKTEVAFSNISAGQFTNAYWKFGNGTTNYTQNPTIDFAGTGLHEACLTVFDTVSGCQDEFCVKVPLIDDTTVYCDANFGFFIDGNTVKLEPKVKGNITGLVWDYNDGFNTNDSFPTHTYANDGVYDICLTVFDSVSGCFNTHCEPVSIITDITVIDEHVKADYSYYLDPTDGLVHFKDESVGSATKWYWDFGDGDSAGVTQNPTYQYEKDGYYEVCLTAKNDNGGQETFCKIISVGDVSDACYAKFDYYANAVTATAHFDNKTLGRINEYNWDFGDSITSLQFKPSHTYADTGFYAVCLTVTNDSGCVSTYCKEIRVGNALENKCLIGCVWPGDANLDLEANHYDILPMGLHYGETGPVRDEVNSDWRGHESQDWSSYLWGDVNNKHGDANGDGIIDITDLEVIKTNFAYSHPWQPRASNSNQLSIDWDADDIDVGETAVLVVSIPDSVNVSMYGLGFEIDLDPNVYDYTTIQYDFTNSWLGTEGADLITFGLENENLGQIYIAESRNDHTESTGNGELVTITVLAKAKSSNGGAVLTTEGGVDAQGDTVKFSGAADDANINNIDERNGYTIKELVVFPNPTHNDVSYNLPLSTATEYKIDVFDNVGKLVHSESQTNGGKVTTSLKEFNSGIYTIQVSSDKVKYIQKIILAK